MRLPNFIVRLFKKLIDRGYANCLIYAWYMHEVYGWKMVLVRTTHNRWGGLVWWHVLAKPPECPLAGGKCLGEEAFEPLDYKNVIFPPPLFKGKVNRNKDKLWKQ